MLNSPYICVKLLLWFLILYLYLHHILIAISLNPSTTVPQHTSVIARILVILNLAAQARTAKKSLTQIAKSNFLTALSSVLFPHQSATPFCATFVWLTNGNTFVKCHNVLDMLGQTGFVFPLFRFSVFIL